MHRAVALLALTGITIGTLACASPPPAPGIDAPALVPAAGERVDVDQLVLLVDASSSMPEDGLFRDQKALVESFVRSAPEGDYETSIISFGGYQREIVPLGRLSRERAAAEAATLEHKGEGTPIHTALDEAAAQLEGRGGRAAVVVYSDGVLTDGVGRDLESAVALEAAQRVVEAKRGEVCFHGVQVGTSARGAALLEELSRTTGCGSFRRAERIDGVASLHALEREVFLGAAPLPAVAAAPRDADRDGVIDAKDLCPGTPRGAGADARGCWTVRDLRFATDSAEIPTAGARSLDEVAEVLKANPELRVRVEGHTDSRGAASYNQRLSERRADAARDYLIERGIAAERLEARGLGEGRPAVENAGEESWRANRRTEIQVLR